ncbi:MAG: HAD-superfamily hydrolase, subfamily variant 3 [Anaerocolumna sp.]|jgi:HAD superfamily hydrolase (TIGR01509 family)|nr:HAD-superfamily hydrolase, subfamily variant 3 [Anaerocolumna sp.]
MLKAVIFDMDGVLIDSEPVHAKAHVKAFESINISVPLSYCYKFIGSTTSHMLGTIIDEYHIPKTVEELLVLYHTTLKDIISTEGHIPIPYVVNTIKDLHENGIKLAIASSSSEDEIKEVVDFLGVTNCFEALVSGTTVANPKPAPEVFLKAVKELGVSTRECLIIEDSYNGVCAGNAAGIPVVGFINENSGNQDLSKAFYLIEGFEEINYKFLNKVYKRYYKEQVEISRTQRLILKELSYQDINNLENIILHTINDTPDITFDIGLSQLLQKSTNDSDLNTTSRPKLPTYDIIKAYIDHVYSFYDYGLWGIYLNENNQLAGLCGIQLLERNGINEFELSYLVAPKYQNHAYGCEAVKAAIQYGFHELHLKRIVAYILPDNTSSIKTAEKTGMQLESIVEFNKITYLLYVIENTK